MLREPVRPLDRYSAGAVSDEERITLTQLAERTGIAAPMLRSLEASGLLRPVPADDERCYTSSDARAVRMLLALVGSGVPMEEFMAVARVQLAAASEVAHGAVELFMKYVREPLVESRVPQKQEAERLVASFRLLVQAASGLISYNFERMMLEAVGAEIEAHGNRAERAAMRRETARRTGAA